MSNAVLVKLTEERDGLVEFVDATLAHAAEEQRDLVPTELSTLSSTQERMAEIDKMLEPIVAFEALRASSVRMDRRISAPPTRPAPRSGGGGAEFRSFGDLFVAEDTFATRGALGTRYADDGMSALDLAMQTRAVLVESAPPGSNLLPSPYKYTASAPAFPTPLLDAITTVPVTTASVDIVTYGPEVTGAAVVGEGADKPEGTVVTGVTPTPLETIAVWVQYSRQLASDAPALRALLNSGMTRGVLRKLQAQVTAAIVAGNLPDTTGAAGAPAIEVVRAGMATVEANGYTPNVLLGAPSDLASLDLAVLALGGAAATVLGGGTWGLRPIAVPGLPNMIVADAAAAFVLFLRSGVEIFTTDSDIVGNGSTAKSGFRTNVLTTLAEMRAKGAVQNTAAATDIILTP